MHLEEHGLVQVLKLDPIEVRYIPIHEAVKQIKFFKAGQYDEFNANINAIFQGKNISTGDFEAFYTVIESLRVEPDALLLITKYCVDTKVKDGKALPGRAYVVKVAKQFAYDGYRTVKTVKGRIKELLTQESTREIKKGRVGATSGRPHKKRDYKRGELDHLYTDLSKEEL